MLVQNQKIILGARPTENADFERVLLFFPLTLDTKIKNHWYFLFLQFLWICLSD